MTVGQKGRQTLVTASLQREDGLDKLLETIDPLRIHSFCRIKTTRESSIYAEQRKHDHDSSTGQVPISRSNTPCSTSKATACSVLNCYNFLLTIKYQANVETLSAL